MEVAEIDARERKKAHGSLLRNPQVNSSLFFLCFDSSLCRVPPLSSSPKRMYPMLRQTLSSLNTHKCMNQ